MESDSLNVYLVTAVALQPNQWSGSKFESISKGAVFVLKDLATTKPRYILSIFPEMRWNELHEVRSVITSISQST